MRFYTDFTVARLQLYKRGLYFGSYQTGTISRKIHMRQHKKGEKNEETEKDFFGRAVPCDGAIIAGGCCRTVGQYSTDGEMKSPINVTAAKRKQIKYHGPFLAILFVIK